jgi:hypothetical protein
VSSHADTIHAVVSGLRCEGADEYADAVDALSAENQQLEADRLEAIRLAKKTQRLRERAMAENQRLRDALEQIERMSRPCGAYGRVDYGSLPAASKIARAALAAVRVEEA